MYAKSIALSSTSSPARIVLALLCIALLVSPDLALAQEPGSPCTTGTWTTVSSSGNNLAPPGSVSYYGVETLAATTATVGGTNFLYALGGMNCNTATSYNSCSPATSANFQTKVGRVVLNSDGSLGNSTQPTFTWQDLWTPLNGSGPVGLGRDLCGVIYTSPTTSKNYIYTVGGYAWFPGASSAALTNQIWYAQLYPTSGQNLGELLTWHQAMKTDGKTPIVLPSALDLEGVAILNGYLYIIGGSTNPSPSADSGITDAVWSIQLNQSSGNLIAANTPTGFTSQPPILPPPNGATYTGGIFKTCPIAYPTSSTTGMIYMAGGETNNPTLPNFPLTGTVEYAVQGANGVLTDGMGHNQWGTATSLPVTLASQAVVYNTGIILMGGQDATNPSQDTASVYLGTINSNTAISWANSLDSLNNILSGVIERNAGATSGDFIYSLGGEVSSGGHQSDSRAINCLKISSN